jgi:glycosyltransferase involved in cell wall biosynthesis
MKTQFSLSIIIPSYNSKNYLKDTLEHLYAAIESAKIQNFEIIIVDDGSTDGTFEYLISQKYNQLSVVRQSNTGRLAARLTGLNNANYDQIVFLDSRVWVDSNSLLNLGMFIDSQKKAPKMVISNISFPKGTNLLGLFWDAIARVVWFRFYQGNENVLLTTDNFDKFPKGTTYLYVEKEIINDSYSRIPTDQIFSHDTNDDTLLIRDISERADVVILKSFQATYFPRTNFLEFCSHTKHRGSVAQGGFFAPKALGRKILFKLLFVQAILASLLIVVPPRVLIGFLFILVIAIEILVARLLTKRHLFSLNLYAGPFIVFYIFGFLQKYFRR